MKKSTEFIDVVNQKFYKLRLEFWNKQGTERLFSFECGYYKTMRAAERVRSAISYMNMDYMVLSFYDVLDGSISELPLQVSVQAIVL